MGDAPLDQLPDVYRRYFRLRDGLDDTTLANELGIAPEALPSFRRIAEAKLANATAASPRQTLVLVVEDSEVNQKLATILLTAHGCRVTIAATGGEAIASAQRERPDVIALDVVLPDMNGTDVLAALRADAATASVPVVAVTALAMIGDRERLLAAGFDGYLAKPVNARTFASELLAVTRGGPARGAPAGH